MGREVEEVESRRKVKADMELWRAEPACWRAKAEGLW